MADTNAIVFPDEVDAAKAAAAEDKTKGGDSNSIEESTEVPELTSRNMITAPSNCPPGFQMGADGKCREVFD